MGTGSRCGGRAPRPLAWLAAVVAAAAAGTASFVALRAPPPRGPGDRDGPIPEVAVRALPESRLPPRGFALRVAVRDAAGAPVAGAAVEALPEPPPGPGSLLPREEGAAGTTGPDGTATLAVPRRCVLRVRAVAEGLATAEVLSTEASVTLRLAPAAAISGRLVDDATGEPLPGARVVLLAAKVPPGATTPVPRRATAGPDGAFRFPLLPAGAWTVVGDAEDRRPARAAAATVAGEETVVALRASAGVAVRGRVRIPSLGRFATSGSVAVREFHEGLGAVDRRAVLDAQGRFTLAALERYPRGPVLVEAEGIPYGALRLPVVPLRADGTPEADEVTLPLPPPPARLEWKGRVLDAAGTPVPGALVAFGPASAAGAATPPHPDWIAWTRAGGSFRWAPPPATATGGGPAVIVPGHAVRRVRMPRYTRDRDLGDIALEEGGRLVVTVVDAAGNRLPGVEVRAVLREARDEESGPVPGPPVAPAVTDGSGRALLSNLDAGRWMLEARRGDRSAAVAAPLPGTGVAAADIVLR